MADASQAIGVFDSGVGGLTVARRITERLPRESIIYLGDTARVPYGTKSASTVIRYARGCAKLLMDRHIKLLVVACNTASACAIEVLREELDIPVLGVIGPGAQAAVTKSKQGIIGVIGTAGTIASQAYPHMIQALNPSARVHCKACPLFVPLAEEGWTSGSVPEAVAQSYLGELLEADIDTLVLGCTHYPMLTKVISHVAGNTVTLVDSAEETARVVHETLEAMDLHQRMDGKAEHRFLVSDAPEIFCATGQAFLGHTLDDVEWVDF